MTDFCAVCMKPADWHGFITSNNAHTMLIDGDYCTKHMITRLRQTATHLLQHKIRIERIRNG